MRRFRHGSLRVHADETSPSFREHRRLAAAAFLHDRLMLTPRSTPEDGDLVIREDSRNGERVYLLCTAPGADQYLLRSRDEAIAQATRFAMRLRVRAWLSRDGEDCCTLIVDYRPALAGD